MGVFNFQNAFNLVVEMLDFVLLGLLVRILISFGIGQRELMARWSNLESRFELADS